MEGFLQKWLQQSSWACERRDFFLCKFFRQLQNCPYFCTLAVTAARRALLPVPYSPGASFSCRCWWRSRARGCPTPAVAWGAPAPLIHPGEHQHPSSMGRREEEVPRVLQVGDRAVPSEGRPRGGPPPEGQRPQPELQTPWWEPDSLLRNHLGHSNYILYGQITLTVKWQLLSNLKIYIFSYSFFPARLQGTVLATSLLQAQHSTAALAPSSSSTKALPNLHV